MHHPSIHPSITEMNMPHDDAPLADLMSPSPEPSPCPCPCPFLLKFEMHSGAHRRKVTHRWRSSQTKYAPDVIDTIFIGYPNHRGYTSLEVGFDGNSAVVDSSSGGDDAVMPFSTPGTNSTAPRVQLASGGGQGNSTSTSQQSGAILSA